VFTANGSEWENQRAMVNAAFAHTRLKASFPVMRQAVDELVAQIAARDLARPVPVEPLMTQVKESLQNLVKLDIETIVDDTGATKGLKTEINLLSGDIKNKFSPTYAGAPEDVRNFHAAQVQKAQDIIDKNIATLKSLVEFVLENKLDR